MQRNSWIRRVAATAVVATAATAAFQPTALAAHVTIPTRYTSTVVQSDTATRIFDLTNAERRKAGLRPLARSSCLTASAQKWSERMSTEGRLRHSDLRSWMRTCNLRMAGENVAMGGRTAERTVQMWMNSPGHRANILNPRYTQLGVGWAANGSYATQQFGG